MARNETARHHLVIPGVECGACCNHFSVGKKNARTGSGRHGFATHCWHKFTTCSRDQQSCAGGAAFSLEPDCFRKPEIYRDHLLAIGCPKITMREIIRAVINERFGMRRRGILASFQDRYWDMVLHRELVRRQWLPRTEWGQALESLKAERLQLITDVLGRDALITEAERQARRAELEQQRSWLSPEKRGQLIESGGKTPATIGGLG